MIRRLLQSICTFCLVALLLVAAPLNASAGQQAYQATDGQEYAYAGNQQQESVNNDQAQQQSFQNNNDQDQQQSFQNNNDQDQQQSYQNNNDQASQDAQNNDASQQG